MRLELICSGLTKLLVDNSYSPTTINFYKREWKKLNDFLLLEYGDDVFSIDKGLIFLEKAPLLQMGGDYSLIYYV